jgi:hypothetical protein
VLLIGVNRPDKRNAFDLAALEQLSAAHQRADAERAAVAHLRELLPVVLGSEDAAEGLRSFIERRAGRFTGQ